MHKDLKINSPTTQQSGTKPIKYKALSFKSSKTNSISKSKLHTKENNAQSNTSGSSEAPASHLADRPS